jgi:hypothetical protein
LPLCTLTEWFVIVRVVRIRMAGGEKWMDAVLDDEAILLQGSQVRVGERISNFVQGGY